MVTSPVVTREAAPRAVVPGPPGRPVARPDARGRVMLSWEPPLSSGSDPIVSYLIFGRRGGDLDAFQKLASIAVGTECAASSPFTNLAPRGGGWWEFRVVACGASTQGPHSPPSLPLLVMAKSEEASSSSGVPRSAEARYKSEPVSASQRTPRVNSSPTAPSTTPALDLGGVLGSAFSTIGKLFSGGVDGGGARGLQHGGRRNSTSFLGGGASFGGLFDGGGAPAERATFSVTSEHDATSRLAARAGADPATILERLLDAAAESDRFPLRARSRQLFEWPVRDQRFKHGQHEVEMSLASLWRLIGMSMRGAEKPSPGPDAYALPERLRHLELLPMIIMHATRGERSGRVALDAEPTPLISDIGRDARPATPPPDPHGLGGAMAALPALAPAAAHAPGIAEPSATGAARSPPARMLKRAATVPLKMDIAEGLISGSDVDGQSEHEVCFPPPRSACLSMLSVPLSRFSCVCVRACVCVFVCACARLCHSSLCALWSSPAYGYASRCRDPPAAAHAPSSAPSRPASPSSCPRRGSCRAWPSRPPARSCSKLVSRLHATRY